MMFCVMGQVKQYDCFSSIKLLKTLFTQVLHHTWCIRQFDGALSPKETRS
jgi:hypothetical protein